MRKWLIIGLLAIALVRVEHTGVQINQLEPVEAVILKQEDGEVCIETDTGAKGVGSNLKNAIDNLHTSASSKIFLDTARYLLVTSKTEKMIPQLYDVFRPNTMVCRIRGEAELTGITAYLQNHIPKAKLCDLRAGKQEIQTLYYQEGRGQLVE